uniref:Uncharacterized protein n=1 Tax=Chromera velia CCMP2878 TaxID=1169474 RepID=A0A0G4IAP7_9ALVE|eukprot:Cvel_12511.t1-p1 / transcript=Cvel_12511.t1 / gene=Cvel_12511 / organism=Chromera_velia_CCMP2878 / gene_product=hypothetical protein / transcript_product=hypothetical protein / location=Cvel_scaffold821:11530-11730(-) / protein_length=67 / sequence_SO=supercontig / SO=protein_coding / is_pseudo=false
MGQHRRQRSGRSGLGGHEVNGNKHGPGKRIVGAEAKVVKTEMVPAETTMKTKTMRIASMPRSIVSPI